VRGIGAEANVACHLVSHNVLCRHASTLLPLFGRVPDIPTLSARISSSRFMSSPPGSKRAARVSKRRDVGSCIVRRSRGAFARPPGPNPVADAEPADEHRRQE
jgi:hypothetical protein